MPSTNKQFILPVLLFSFILGCSSPSDKHFNKKSEASVYVDPVSGKTIRKIAIMPFKGPTELIGCSVSDLFVTEILKTGQYTLVERSQMANLLGETELALSGLTAGQAAEAARLVGADGVLVGSVPEYQMQAYRGKTYPVVGISVRMIDAKTGKIVWSANHSATAEEKRTALSTHARALVHEISSAVYYAMKKRR